MTPRSIVVALALAIAGAGCASGTSYGDVSGPRYSGGAASARAAPDSLRLVTFNLEYADSVDAAIRLLTVHPELSDADVVFLQEMDADATGRIAAALGGVAWVYYPSTLRKNTGRDFGNAILSRWPIEADEKLILPHVGYLGRTQRIATAATLRIGDARVRVYSVHLGTMLDLSGADRVDQLETVLDDARDYAHVVIAGDLNDEYVGRLALERGYAWPTRDVPYTARAFGIPGGTWDHVVVKGLGAGPAGVVDAPEAVSDHKPVWTRAIPP